MQNYIFSLFNTRLYYGKSTNKSACGENVGKMWGKCGENVGKNQANKKAKRLTINHLAFHSVPRPGVEPGWMLLHWCLRPARLPIPPSGQLNQGICISLIAVQR